MAQLINSFFREANKLSADWRADYILTAISSVTDHFKSTAQNLLLEVKYETSPYKVDSSANQIHRLLLMIMLAEFKAIFKASTLRK